MGQFLTTLVFKGVNIEFVILWLMLRRDHHSLFKLKAFLKAVQNKIEEIDQTFHLVMILENFQVSFQ